MPNPSPHDSPGHRTITNHENHRPGHKGGNQNPSPVDCYLLWACKVNFVCDFKSTLTENLLKQPLATALLISCREVTGCPVFVVATAALIVAHTKRAKVKGFFTFVSL
jgi:hypothetical protein